MSDIIGKVVQPTVEFLEDLTRKLPEALGAGHHRVGQHIHTAADEFDKAEDDLTNAARHTHDHAGSSSGPASPTSGGTGDGEPTAGHHGPALPGSHATPALTAGPQLSRTLSQVRAIKAHRQRWEAGETYAREIHGGEPEQHFPVPPNADPDFPVTAVGGRKVDCPVHHPDGSVTAIEIKTYGKYRTVAVPDGANVVHKVEVPLSAHVREQINKDVALRDSHPGYDPRWEFLGAGPSQELRDHLTKAKIIFVEHH